MTEAIGRQVADKLVELPTEKQGEVLDFVEFLLQKSRSPSDNDHQRAKQKFINRFVHRPLEAVHFEPLSRHDAHSR